MKFLGFDQNDQKIWKFQPIFIICQKKTRKNPSFQNFSGHFHNNLLYKKIQQKGLFGIIKNWQGQKGKIPFLIFNNNQLVFSDRLIILEHIGISRMKGTGNSIKPVFRVPVYQNKKVDLNNIRIFLLDPNTGIHEMEISQSALSYPNQLIPKHRFYGALSYCQDEKPQTQNKMIPAKPSGKSITSECF